MGRHVRVRHANPGTGASGINARTTHGGPWEPEPQSPWAQSQSDKEPYLSPQLTDGIIDGGAHILPGSIDIVTFADDIRPPRVVTSLPALPDTEYPQGSLVFLTTDEKLYRNTDGSTWSVEVDGEDIVANSITAGQIAAAAIGTDELAADAVIANVINAGGTVTIDSDGITITDGAIVLEDYAGQSSLGAYGFEGAWLGFLADGVYNSSFDYGVTGTALTASDGGPEGHEDYKAALSTQLPGWIVAEDGTNPARVRLMSDANALGGFALRFDSASGGGTYVTSMIVQDVPVLPGDKITLRLRWRYGATGAGNDLNRAIFWDWKDADRFDLGLGASEGSSYSDVQAFFNEDISIPDSVPEKARYLRITISFQTHGAGAALIDAVRIIRSSLEGLSLVSVEDSTSGIRVTPDEITFGAGAGDWTGPALSRDSVSRLNLSDSLEIAQGGLALGTASVPSSATAILLGADVEIQRVAGPVFVASARQRWSTIVSAAQITATQNNYNPSGLAGTSILQIFSDAARAITGIAAGTAGDRLVLLNTGGFTITLQHLNAGSSATNQIACPGGATYNILSNGSVELVYYSGKWRVLSV